MPSTTPHTVAQVFAFWRPLAGTLLLMAAEAPIVVSVRAREPGGERCLAAYAVALSITVLFESPILRILSAAIALVSDAISFKRFRLFTLANSALMTLLLFALTLDAPFQFLSQKLLGLTAEISPLVLAGLVIFSPSPLLVGYRRMFQGVLIRSGRPRAVAFCTTVRVLVFAATAIWILPYFGAHGVALAAWSHVLALIAEACVSRFLVRSEIAKLLATPSSAESPARTYGQIARFYYPLSLSSMIGQLLHPIQAALVLRGHLPVQSLALLPAVQGFANLFSWSAFAIQDTALALAAQSQSALPTVKRFALYLGLGLSGLYALIVCSVLGRLWFGGVNSLDEALLPLALNAATLLIPLPALVVWRSLQRALLLAQGRSMLLFAADIFDILAALGCAALLILSLDVVGAYAVLLGTVVGTLCNAALLRRALARA